MTHSVLPGVEHLSPQEFFWGLLYSDRVRPVLGCLEGRGGGGGGGGGGGEGGERLEKPGRRKGIVKEEE